MRDYIVPDIDFFKVLTTNKFKFCHNSWFNNYSFRPMLKMRFLSLILIAGVLSACGGFHTPTKSTLLNASVNASRYNVFATELKKHFDAEEMQYLSIKIGDETRNNHTASYKLTGEAKSYTLTLSVPITVFDHNNLLLLSQTFKESTHLKKIEAKQADKLQNDAAYAQLRSSLIKKLLRKLYRLNES